MTNHTIHEKMSLRDELRYDGDIPENELDREQCVLVLSPRPTDGGPTIIYAGRPDITRIMGEEGVEKRSYTLYAGLSYNGRNVAMQNVAEHCQERPYEDIVAAMDKVLLVPNKI